MSGTLRLSRIPPPVLTATLMVSDVKETTEPLFDYKNDPEQMRAAAILGDSKMGTMLEGGDLEFILDVLSRHPDIDSDKAEARVVVVGRDAEGRRSRHFRLVYPDNTFQFLHLRECFNPLFMQRRDRIRAVRDAHAANESVQVCFKVGDNLPWKVYARRATASMVMSLDKLPPPIPGGGGPISMSAEDVTLIVPLRTKLHRKTWLSAADILASENSRCTLLIHGHLELGNTLSDIHAAIQKPYKPAEPQPPVP